MKRPLLALAALAACVDVSRPATRSAARAVAQERARDDAADLARLLARVPVGVVQREQARVFGREGTTTHVAAGPLRYDIRADGVSPADDVPPEPISAAAKGAGGWVFVAGSAVYASATFTGRLRLLRSFGCEPSPDAPDDDPTVTLPAGAGRVAVTVRGQGAFVSDGATLAALDVPGAVDSAWRDASNGAVIVAHRALRVTTDGGRTWREVDTGGETPALVAGRAGALVVATEGGVRRIDERALTLAPDAPAEAPCEPAPATPPPFDRGYERLPPPPSAETCERLRERLREVWAPPRFDVTLPGARGNPPDDFGEVTWSFRGARPAPFGPLWARAQVESEAAAAVVRATARATARGYSGGIVWRGRDAAGPFLAAAIVRQPREVPAVTRWELIAATRRGALLLLDALPAGRPYVEDEPGDDLIRPTLFWATAAGLRRVPSAPLPAATAWGAVLTDDGGAVALGTEMSTLAGPCDVNRFGTHGRSMAYALHVGPDGASRGLRVAVEDPAARSIVGVGQRGDRWGLVVAERDAPGGLQWLPFRGGREDFGAWRLDDVPRACGAAAGEVTRLHVAFVPAVERDVGVFLGARDVAPDGPLASPRHLVLERDAAGVCVRRVTGVYDAGRVELSPENFQSAHGSLILDANAGRLSGIWDDGRRVAPVTATLAPTPPPPPR